MNASVFIQHLSAPEKLDSATLPEIGGLVKEFPYCQTAWLLYIKNLHNLKDVRFNGMLKTAAIYSADRKALYHLIMRKALVEKIKEVEKSENREKIDRQLEALEKEILKEALVASYTLEDTESACEQLVKTEPAEAPVAANEKMTLAQWMSVLKSGHPAVPGKTVSAPKSSVDTLLEKLSRQEQRPGTKKEFFTPSNIGRLSLVEDDKFVTETLAKIYEQQGNYPKAISAYKNLGLKFPEKSTYFAARISDLEAKLSKK